MQRSVHANIYGCPLKSGWVCAYHAEFMTECTMALGRRGLNKTALSFFSVARWLLLYPSSSFGSDPGWRRDFSNSLQKRSTGKIKQGGLRRRRLEKAIPSRQSRGREQNACMPCYKEGNRDFWIQEWTIKRLNPPITPWPVCTYSNKTTATVPAPARSQHVSGVIS